MVTSQKIHDRIRQSKWTKLYVISACLQGITIIILQAIIVYYNTLQVNKGLESSAIQTYDLSTTEVSEINSAVDRLLRIKWENIAFILFQCWFVGMSFDATVYQNAAEVIALAVMNLVCAIFCAFEVIDCKRWLNILNDIKFAHNVPIITNPIQMEFFVEIALSIVVGLYAIIFAFLSYKVVKEFGWVVYKKIGADTSIQRMYKTLQFFVLALKMDIFIEFLASVSYLIQYALEGGYTAWSTYIFVVITILMPPMFYFGRAAVASESPVRMYIFIFFQVVVVFQLSLILAGSFKPAGDYWYTWICFVVIGMIFAVITAVLAGICIHNFGKGLKPYVQRGAEKKEIQQEEQQKESAAGDNWIIDEV